MYINIISPFCVFFLDCLSEEVEASAILPLSPLKTYLAHGHLRTLDGAVHHMDQCNDHPNPHIAVYTRRGLITLCSKAAGYAFQRILCLHDK